MKVVYEGPRRYIALLLLALLQEFSSRKYLIEIFRFFVQFFLQSNNNLWNKGFRVKLYMNLLRLYVWHREVKDKTSAWRADCPARSYCQTLIVDQECRQILV